MSKKTNPKEMIKRVFTVAEILAQYQSDTKNSEQAEISYPSAHAEKHEAISDKNTNP